MMAIIRNALPEADEGRALAMTPGFHIHALIVLLGQLLSGGTVICTQGFRPESFLGWMT